MSTIQKINNQFRVRFHLRLPTGEVIERSRRAGKLGKARELKAIADIIEAKVSRDDFTADDLGQWRRLGILSATDTQKLAGFQGGSKTLGLAAEEYRKSWGRISDKEDNARDGRLKNILRILGTATQISTLRHSHGEAVKAELRAMGYKAVTINKHLQDLKRLLALQVAERAIDFHPFAAIKGARVPAGEKINHIIPTEDLIIKIIEAAEQLDQGHRPILGGHLALFLLMFFGCGLRRGEALAARLENIDWQARSLLLTKTKTGAPRIVGLGIRLFTKLLGRKGEEGFILPRIHQDSVSRAVRNHLRSHGAEGMRLHDTRHTYTTMLQNHGVSPIEAMGRTGHADMRMLSHYSHPKIDIIHEDRFGFMQEEEKTEHER